MVLQIFILHVVVRSGVYIPKDGQRFLIAAQSFLVLLFFKERIAFLFELLTEIHLDHVVLLSDSLIFLTVVEPRLEVLRQ